VNSRHTVGRRRPSASRRHWILLGLLPVWLGGCELSGRRSTGDRYVPPQAEKVFSVLFQQNCAGCHGKNGKLGPAPPLNDELFLALIRDEEIKRVITQGRAGTLMPAFAAAEGGHLTADQVEILVEGIKREWGADWPPPDGAPPYMLSSAGSDTAVSGKPEDGLNVFARACASCHGEQGRGGRFGDKPVGAVRDPDFLALCSDQVLRRYVITGRSDLGMPGYADPAGRPEGFKPLTAEDVTNVVALLAAWRRDESAERPGE
jgi:cytochrome c oxidase cbb3-type subunit III